MEAGKQGWGDGQTGTEQHSVAALAPRPIHAGHAAENAAAVHPHRTAPHCTIHTGHAAEDSVELHPAAPAPLHAKSHAPALHLHLDQAQHHR